MIKKSKFTKVQILLLTILFLTIFGLIGGKYYHYIKNREVGQATAKRVSANKPIAFFFNETNINSLTPVVQGGETLPDDLIIEPGIYKVYGNNYDLQKEGLYRFLDPTKSNQQRIVYKEDIDSLLSGISWISSHGIADKNKTKDELIKKALTDKLSINCGVIALFVLKNLSIKSRIVTTLTLEEPWNSYDTGHTLVEVYKKDHWQVYDLDNNVVFKRGERYLNFLEFVESVKNNDYTIEKIADDAEYAVGGSVKDGYDYSFYFEAILSNEATLRDWYKKVIQVPLIGDDSLTYYFFDEKNRSRVESYASNYKFLASEEFMKRF